MLVEAIMHDCIFKLLKNGDEESLECMCGLLRTIGKDLDTDKAKVILKNVFHQVNIQIFKKRYAK